MEVNNFYDFRCRVKDEILDYLPELGEATVYLQEILKNNGISRHALQILKPGERITPSIYLESYYEQYRKGEAWQDIMKSIASYYWRNSGRLPIEPEMVLSFADIQNELVYRLVNYEKNKEQLKEAPYIRWNDLALTFRWIAYRDEIGLASSLVTNELMKHWGISIEKLKDVTSKNMLEQFPPLCISLVELLGQQNGNNDMLKDAQEEGCPMFVLTNSQKINGAGTIFYPGILEKLSEKHGMDFFLLPSSIHEMILIPAYKEICVGDLQEIVKSANREAVTEGDYLSNQVYFYDRLSKEIRQL